MERSDKIKKENIKRIMQFLDDPSLSYQNGKVCVKWICETYSELQATFNVVIDSFHSEGYHGPIEIALKLYTNGKKINVKEKFFIIQYPKNHSLNDICGSYGPRG